jgi:predicted  nucleic acid-binding Zn-ribbon protein
MREALNAALKWILEIQELDMQMIQLMRLRKERQKETDVISATKDTLRQQAAIKEKEITELRIHNRLLEGDLTDVEAKFKKLETQQHAIKKVDEFNALNHEMSQVERERSVKQQRLNELQERISVEEATLKTLEKALQTTAENSKALELEIHEAIARINEEGRKLKQQRDVMAVKADPEVFRIYERLLQNKKDRVIVAIENRCCSGCHIMLTAQDENMVRKGERLVFCEHCSRIHYWQESEAIESPTVATKQRRRRASAKT